MPHWYVTSHRGFKKDASAVHAAISALHTLAMDFFWNVRATSHHVMEVVLRWTFP
jgi:hypothetical protein